MKIYGAPFSVHTRKVIIAVKLKSIPHEVLPVVPVIPGNPPPNWLEISPTGLIPALDDEGFRLGDSTAIVAYLDKKYPTPALLPADARRYPKLDGYFRAHLDSPVLGPILEAEKPLVAKMPGLTPEL